MPIFTAIAAGVTALATAIGFGAAAAATIGAVGAFAARTLLTIGITKLLTNRAGTTAAGASDSGARVQLPPSTNNALPVVYGSAYVAPTMTDAKISTDQKTMWYVMALSEVPDDGLMSYGDIYYNGNRVTFDSTDPAKVIKLTNNANPPQEDTKVDGSLYMYLFTNGSFTGVNTGGLSAIDIMSDASIEAAQRWDSTLYTQGGTGAAFMRQCAFIIVKIVYNRDSGLTQLGQINVQLHCDIAKPGTVLLDYMVNPRYGCAIPLENIDTASLALLNAYSDELITYTPVGGGSATIPRYRINGPINTGQSCLTNLQVIADSCDSWLQYSELTGQWKIVINQSYTDYTTTEELYHVDSYNLIGGIDVNPIDSNATYNIVEIQYPDANIKDQTNFKIIHLYEYVPEVMSPNEPVNRLIIQYPVVNNYVQAMYLGERRMLQSREDLVVSFSLDYSGIQISAGDVIRITLNEYGWCTPTFPDGKLFRVTQVQETKDDSGFLGARITASEYNDTIYANNPIEQFIPEANTGLTDPNIHSDVLAPAVTTSALSNGTVKSFTVNAVVPTTGTVTNMDFNYGISSDTTTHKLYKTVSPGNGKPYVNGTSVSIPVTDVLAATYYWSVTARNLQSGRNSPSSSAYVWSGPNVTTYDANTNTGGISFSNIGTGTGAQSVLATYTYSIAKTLTSPIYNTIFDLTTYGTAYKTYAWNKPKSLIGTTVSGTKYNPYYQGTSSTADGFQYNSTAPYTPSGANYLYIENGDANWWILEYGLFSNTVPSSQYYRIFYNATLISDIDTTIQYCNFTTFSDDATGMSFRNDKWKTLDVKATVPTELLLDFISSGSGTVDGAGVVVRNFDPSATIISMYAYFVVYQVK
jgi:hypothetical protein